MTPIRHRYLSAFLGACLLQAARGWALPSELDHLRDIEQQAMRVIEVSKRAFVFLEGGSGFIISPDGHMLTNAHVVVEALSAKRFLIRAHLAGGKPVTADILGTDPEGDVALLKVRPDPKEPGVPFAYLELGDSEAVRGGQRVVALGDPFLIASANIFIERPPPDYEPSASLGVVSAVHRNSDTYTDAIQVDVAVNRGNSGGPLLTLDGKVVGINGKIETRFDTGVNTGVGYAIPTRQVQRFLEPLKKANGGSVRHGVVLGLESEERAGEKEGLAIQRVKASSPAEMAGFKEGDRILSVDDLPVRSRRRLEGILGTYPAGCVVTVKLLRGSDTLELKIELVEAGPLPFLGLTAKTDEGPDGGARILSIVPGSPAARAGIQVDDLVVGFNKVKILSHVELELQLQTRRMGDLVSVSIIRDGKTLEIEVRIGGRGNS